MYNRRIPLEEYQKTAREVDASGFNALENCKIGRTERNALHHLCCQTSRWILPVGQPIYRFRQQGLPHEP